MAVGWLGIVARLDFKQGRFNAQAETNEINTGLRGFADTTGDEIRYFRFDRADSVIDNVYDEGGDVGRVFRGPFTVPVIHATHTEGESEQSDTGFYSNDTLHVSGSFSMLRRIGMSEMDLKTRSYLKDRIVYDDVVFRVVTIEILGQIQQKDVIVSIDATQVKPDELVDDYQFRRWSSTPDGAPYVPPVTPTPSPYNPPNPAGPQWFFGIVDPTTTTPANVALYDMYLNENTGVIFKRGTTGWVTQAGSIKGPTIVPFVFSAGGDLIVTVGRGTLVMPFAGTITGVVAHLVTPSASGNVVLDLKKGGASVYTTTANRPTFVPATLSVDATLPDVITFNRLDYFSVDILQVGTNAADLSLTLLVKPT